MMKIIAIVVLLSFSISATSQTNPAHDEKVHRLDALFKSLDLQGPSNWEFQSLQTFAMSMNDWANAAVSASRAEWSGIDKASMTSPLDRYLKASSLKFEGTQQPKTVQLYDQVAQKNVASVNPDKWLYKGSITTDWSQLFVGPSDVLSHTTGLRDAGVELSDQYAELGLCGKYLAKDTAKSGSSRSAFQNCVLRMSGPAIVGRVFSGFTTSFSWAENPSVINGAYVTGKYVLDNQSFGGEADYKPTNIFLTGSDWKAAYQTAALYGSVHENQFVRIVAHVCGITVDADKPVSAADRRALLRDKCVDALAVQRGGWSRLAELLVPTATFTEKTNFDFVASAGTFTPNPYPSKRLAGFNFTLDLNRLLPSAKSRQDALALMTTIAKAKPDPPKTNKRMDLARLIRIWANSPETIDSDGGALYNQIIAAITDVQNSL